MMNPVSSETTHSIRLCVNFPAKLDRYVHMCYSGCNPIGYADSRTAHRDEGGCGQSSDIPYGVADRYKNPGPSCDPVLIPLCSLITVSGLISSAYTHHATI